MLLKVHWSQHQVDIVYPYDVVFLLDLDQLLDEQHVHILVGIPEVLTHLV